MSLSIHAGSPLVAAIAIALAAAMLLSPPRLQAPSSTDAAKAIVVVAPAPVLM